MTRRSPLAALALLVLAPLPASADHNALYPLGAFMGQRCFEDWDAEHDSYALVGSCHRCGNGMSVAVGTHGYRAESVSEVVAAGGVRAYTYSNRETHHGVGVESEALGGAWASREDDCGALP